MWLLCAHASASPYGAPYGSSSPAPAANPYAAAYPATSTANPYGSASPNPYGSSSTPNPYGSASSSNPYSGSGNSAPDLHAPNPYSTSAPNVQTPTNPYGSAPSLQTPANPYGSSPYGHASGSYGATPSTPNPYASATPGAPATPNPYGAPPTPNNAPVNPYNSPATPAAAPPSSPYFGQSTTQVYTTSSPAVPPYGANPYAQPAAAPTGPRTALPPPAPAHYADQVEADLAKREYAAKLAEMERELQRAKADSEKQAILSRVRVGGPLCTHSRPHSAPMLRLPRTSASVASAKRASACA